MVPLSLELVVPCYNEEARLDSGRFLHFVRSREGVRLLFVDDGSRDGTAALLEQMRAAAPEHVRCLMLERNSGKAEAVRRGIVSALEDGTDVVGFWDADLATPLEVADEFMTVLEKRAQTEVVMGARIQLLGRAVERRAMRHYIGRVFATAASLALRMPVYDTQCGAKLFRASPEMTRVFATPFRSRWVFDVEILARLSELWGDDVRERVYEHPVPAWKDVGASKLRPVDGLVAARDLLGIALRRGKALGRVR